MPVADNVLNRDFAPTQPNRAWVSDITCIPTDEGWLYLAEVLDLFNREVVGWSIKPRMTADIVTDALAMAWFRRKPQPGAIFHSDRGSQYASQAVRYNRRRRHSTLGYCSPAQFLADWLSKHDAQRPRAA